LEAALEPAHTARSRRRSSCPAVWIDRQLTGRSAALRRHHAALPSEDTPHTRCAAARSVIPHSQTPRCSHWTRAMSPYVATPSVHRTPCCPGVHPNGTRHQGVHGTVWCTEASCLSMCAPARAARVGAQPPAPTRSKTCPLPTGHKGGSAARQRQRSQARATRRPCSAKTAPLRKLRTRIKSETHTLFWHFSQKACKTSCEQTNIVPVRQHRQQNGPVVVAVHRKKSFTCCSGRGPSRRPGASRG